jgi:hypothetical protein
LKVTQCGVEHLEPQDRLRAMRQRRLLAGDRLTPLSEKTTRSADEMKPVPGDKPLYAHGFLLQSDSVRREEKIMPFLDVTDVLLDPDFVDLSLVCYRQVQTVDEDNFPTNTAQAIPFSGVVTVDRSLEAKRMAAGQNINGAILIVTQFRLTQGMPASDSTPELDADIVLYSGRRYRVTFVDPYTRYGAGFVQAHCELLEFNGGIPVE